MPAPATLDVDPGPNGSIHVRGWEKAGEMRLRTRVAAWASDQARTTEMVKAVRVTSSGGRIRSDGPMMLNREHWSTSFYLDVPRSSGLALNAGNGGISVEEVRGTLNLRTENGGIKLRHVAGDVRGRTRNGALRVELSGARWDGTGLDLETHNGAIRLSLPANYSAEVETGTVNGRVEIDFPVLIHAGRERRFTTTLGSGGPKIRAITHNGSLSIKRL
jgi:hypothetical protein